MITGGEDGQPDGEAVYAHYALHRLKILPGVLMNLPDWERAFIYASIDEQIANEKKAQKKAERNRSKQKGG